MIETCFKRKLKPLLVSLVVLATVSIGVTTAYMISSSEPVVNSFDIGDVSCQVVEEYQDSVKSNVNVTNTGNVPAFIRVRLVTYRVDDQGNHIGGTAEIPAFTLGEGWVLHEGYYYYKYQVEPGSTPEANLIGGEGIALKEYFDTDGGKQVVEVLAEAVQSQGKDDNGASPVELAWGIESQDGRLIL